MANDDKHPTICAKCEHMMPDGFHPWKRCDANPGINYVLGSVEYKQCRVKNDTGTCADYAPAPAPPDEQADEAYGSDEGDERGVE